jgi:hypothetical protein
VKTTLASRISRSALRVSRSGSPGPRPPARRCPARSARVSHSPPPSFRRSGAGSPGGTSRSWCPPTAPRRRLDAHQALAADRLENRLHADVEAHADDRPAIGLRRRGRPASSSVDEADLAGGELRNQPVAIGQPAAAGEVERALRRPPSSTAIRSPPRAPSTISTRSPFGSSALAERGRIAVPGQLDEPALPTRTLVK